MKLIGPAVIGALVSAMLAATSLHAQPIGAVEDVVAVAFATPPAASRIRVVLRSGVVSNELLET